MKVTLAAIAARAPGDAFQTLAALYLERLQQYASVESKIFRSESAFAEAIAATRGRTAPTVVLLDSRGKSLTSFDFAQWVGRRRDDGAQNLVFAIGPADGWSEAARSTAAQANGLLLSLGPMTLPHELARVVLAEQLYRAFTILASHPYHSGH
jgi:23S rRNA (pseudouridine1915-N3)-methyltransferase